MSASPALTVAPGPVIETERLILRPTALEDFDGFCALMADERTARFIGGVQPPSVVWRAFRAMAGAWTLDGFAMFSVVEKASGRWIGRLGPWSPGGWPGTEVGWGLLLEAQGKGYAVEGAAAAMDFAIDRLGWTDVIHVIDPENVPSQKVAERLGSRDRGRVTLPAPFHESLVHAWGQTADEWRANRRRLRP